MNDDDIWSCPEATTSFFFRILSVIPAAQHPNDFIVPDNAAVLKRANSFQGPSKAINIIPRSEWRAGERYRERIRELEMQLARERTKQ